MWWPVLIIVLSNCFYHICAKSTPDGVNAFGTLTVTYLTAAALAAALFVIGALLYGEKITLRQVLGAGVCLAGLVLMNK